MKFCTFCRISALGQKGKTLYENANVYVGYRFCKSFSRSFSYIVGSKSYATLNTYQIGKMIWANRSMPITSWHIVLISIPTIAISIDIKHENGGSVGKSSITTFEQRMLNQRLRPASNAIKKLHEDRRLLQQEMGKFTEQIMKTYFEVIVASNKIAFDVTLKIKMQEYKISILQN